MDILYGILIKHDMELSYVEKEITIWLEALLQLVDITEKQSIDYFTQGEEAVIVKYLNVSVSKPSHL